MPKKAKINSNNRRIQEAQAKKGPQGRVRNRCSQCGRPRAYMRVFGVCRICFRLLANEGKIPGVTKSSW